MLEEEQQAAKSSSNKRKRCSTIISDTSSAAAKQPVQHGESSYWESMEAHKLFWPLVTERDALEGIHDQIELLRMANGTPNGYFAFLSEYQV